MVTTATCSDSSKGLGRETMEGQASCCPCQPRHSKKDALLAADWLRRKREHQDSSIIGRVTSTLDLRSRWRANRFPASCPKWEKIGEKYRFRGKSEKELKNWKTGSKIGFGAIFLSMFFRFFQGGPRERFGRQRPIFSKTFSYFRPEARKLCCSRPTGFQPLTDTFFKVCDAPPSSIVILLRKYALLLAGSSIHHQFAARYGSNFYRAILVQKLFGSGVV